MSAAAPLAGVRVVVTRPARQAEGLCAAFAAAGARVERLPLIEVVPPADPSPLLAAAADLASYRWVIFTSANAVRALVDAAAGGLPAGLRLATVGGATTSALREAGLEPSLEGEGGGESLAELLAFVGKGGRILFPAAQDARPQTAAMLRASGYEVDEVVAYDKRLPEGTEARAGELFPVGEPIGWVTFTSPRIAEAFAGLFADWEGRRETVRAVSIGATTSEELQRLGVEPAAEAGRPGDEGLVETVVSVEVARSQP
jgi:uroporphyrinogen-III synthase